MTLAAQLDEFDWEWALSNVKADSLEEVDKIKVVLSALKPWLNIELYRAELKAEKAEQAPSSTYLDALRKRGATEEELKEASQLKSNLNQEQDGGIGDDDEFDPAPVAISANR